MGAPADDTRHRKDRRIQLERDVQHGIDKAAVKVHVCADAFVDAALFGDDLGRKPSHGGVQVVLVVPVFCGRKLFHKALKDFRTGVGNRVYRMAHAVNQTFSVESIFGQEAGKVDVYKRQRLRRQRSRS